MHTHAHICKQCTGGSTEFLELPHRVVQFSVGAGRVVVGTQAGQLRIYPTERLGHPLVVELAAVASALVQADGCFLTADRAGGLRVYSYAGALLSSPKVPGARGRAWHQGWWWWKCEVLGWEGGERCNAQPGGMEYAKAGGFVPLLQIHCNPPPHRCHGEQSQGCVATRCRLAA